MQLVWTRIWVDLEVVEVESEEGNGRNEKRKLKNQIFPFRMTMRNGLRGYNYYCWILDFAQPCEIGWGCAKWSFCC